MWCKIYSVMHISVNCVCMCLCFGRAMSYCTECTLFEAKSDAIYVLCSLSLHLDYYRIFALKHLQRRTNMRHNFDIALTLLQRIFLLLLWIYKIMQISNGNINTVAISCTCWVEVITSLTTSRRRSFWEEHSWTWCLVKQVLTTGTHIQNWM